MWGVKWQFSDKFYELNYCGCFNHCCINDCNLHNNNWTTRNVFCKMAKKLCCGICYWGFVASTYCKICDAKMHQYADKKKLNQSQVKQNSQNKTSENVSEANEKEDNKIKETNENIEENKND